MTKFLRAAITVFLFGLLISPSLLFAYDVLLDAPGFDPNRETYSTIPEEHIDPFTGGLTVSQVDWKLPGNGGLDLIIQRSYNSKTSCNLRVQSGVYYCDSWGERTPLGYGWNIHFGRLFVPISVYKRPIVEMPDGSRHQGSSINYSTSSFITKDYWLLDLGSTYVLTKTDGTKIYFGQPSPHTNPIYTDYALYLATKIEDANGNTINIYYQQYSTGYLIDYTIDSVGRRIEFTNSTINYEPRLTSITGPGINITYSHKAITPYDGATLLTSVHFPVGNPYEYTYDESTMELKIIKALAGGVITYTYGNVTFNSPTGYPFYYRTVFQKATSGTVPSGTWTFSYAQGTYGEDTVINDPCGRTTKYSHYGYKSNLSNGNMWKFGLLKSKEITGEETDTYSWMNSSSVSHDDYDFTSVGLGIDYEIYIPLLGSQSITRGGKTYTTNYSSYDSYGNPQSISETGDKNRNKSISYWYNASRNIVKNKPSSETVSGTFPGTFTTNYSYDTDGNLTQINKYGVATNYSYSANGNLYSITDANGKITYYQWTNGRISRITNPIYYISRAISSDGTVASETNGRNYTTYFYYDGNLRLTSIDPPAGNTTYFEYPVDNSYKKETRGGYYIYYYNDGFGRPSGTYDSKGVDTDIIYKSCGPKNYTDSNIGDKTSYDNFGRVTSILHKDNNDITYSYSGSNVTVSDENNGATSLIYNAFGNPDEKLLVSVTDSLNNTTTYDYNILGSLTDITRGTLSRSFSFNSKNFLTSETHPETGTVTYGRDNVGNMTSKTDASGTKNYTYDGLNRLTQISYGGGSVSFNYDYADNKTSMDNPSATIDYTYDAINRLTQKTEVVAGRTYTTSYTYDGNDNLTDIYYPTGRHVYYTYNSNNQATSVDGFGKSISSVSYNTAGLPTSFTSSAGITTNLTYNNRNLTTGISAAYGNILNMGYGYDSRGNTTSITNYLDGSKNQSFTYDAINRLAGFNGAWGTGSYSYDSNGNRLTKTAGGITTSYSYSSNRLGSASGGEPASFSYNGNGSPTSITWQGSSYSLVYDSLDNLTSYKLGATSLGDYTYDGDGMRGTKTSNYGTTVYHYDKDGKVLSETESDGSLIADYVYLNGKLVAKIITAYTVTPSAGAGGSINPSTPQTVDYGFTTTFTVSPNTGYHITLISGCGGTTVGIQPYNTPYNYTTGPISTDCSVTASFAINTYTVTPSAGANGTMSPNTPQTVNYNSTTSFTVTPNTGYHIASISGCGGTAVGVQPTNASYIYTTGLITGDCTVTANFSNTYKVTPVASSGGSISPNTPQTVNYNATTSFTVTPNTGYHITSISGCGGATVGVQPTNASYIYTTGPITGDCSVTANFGNTYTVIPSAGANGSISPNTPQAVTYNSTISFTVTPNTGYHITSISGCGGTSVGIQPYNTPYTFTTGPITADCTVTAGFAINTYTITPSAGANGNISPNTPQTVNYNATTSFTVTPNTGYHITSISGCGGASVSVQPYNTPYTYTTGPITADCTVTAGFVINTYTITPSAGTNGSISPNTPQTVNYNETQALIIMPVSGYHAVTLDDTCTGWLSNNIFTTDPVTADCTVSVAFGLDTADNIVPAGNSISVTPLPGINLTFDNVTTGGNAAVIEMLNPAPPPVNFGIVSGLFDTSGAWLPRSYILNFTGTFTGSETVCLDHEPSYKYWFYLYDGEEIDLKLMQRQGAGWVDITSSGYPDIINHKICGTATSFSEFAVVSPLVSPGAVFTYAKNALAVDFNASSSICPSGNCTYTWAFGDGQAATGVTTSHTYASGGTYTVILTVHDNVYSSTNSKNASVTLSSNQPPVASYTVVTNDPTTWTVTLTDTSTDPDGDLIGSSAIRIYWGEGPVIQGAAGGTFTHVYSTGGTYTIAYRAIDTGGASNTVSPSLVVTFSGPALSVSKSGTGNGTITSTPAGISCGASCSAMYKNNSTVSLSATPDACSTFTGWSGDCAGTTTPVNIVMNGAKTCSANFTINAFTITASAGANGTISPSGINTVNCGGSQTFTISPAAGYHIADVLVDGSSVGAATSYAFSNITANHTISATFINTYTLMVAKAGTGSGTVTSSPSGINCGTGCAATYTDGTTVSLTASAGTDSIFAGWSGGGCSGTGSCTATIDSDKTVTASFTQYITVTVPDGGENWITGTTHAISWTYAGNPGTYVKIELLKNGVLNRTITSYVSKGSNGIGSYNWTIPSTQTLGTDFKVKITSTSNSNYTDTSGNNFTINPPSITVTSPNGGEVLSAGAVKTITWTYAGNPGAYVKIELYKGGVLNRTIISSISIGSGGSGSYNWTILSTQTSGSDYTVKVTSTTNAAYTDTSDNNFTIY